MPFFWVDVSCTVAFDYVDWMWIGCGIYWVWLVLVDMLKRRWSINYTLINLGKVAWYVQAKGRIRIDCVCVAFCICWFVCKWLYTRLIQSIRVLSEYDYISVSWLLLRVCHNFHFFIFLSGVVTLVYVISSWSNLMAWQLIWYYFIALCMFIWVVTGQGPHQGHWALCCLWVRGMFITSIRVNLHIRPCILVCDSLAKRFIVPRGLHIRLGIEIMVWDGRHHLCAVHVVNDIQCVVFDCCNVRCVDVLFFSNMLFWGLVRPIV